MDNFNSCQLGSVKNNLESKKIEIVTDLVDLS